jgi:hypothetical protein
VICVEIDIIFGSADGHTRNSTEPVTLALTIVVSPDASSSLAAVAVNTQNPRTADLDDRTAEGGATCPIIQSNSEIMQSAEVNAPLSPSSRTGDLPIGGGTPVGPVMSGQKEMSYRLDSAEDAMDTVKTWKRAVDIIKQVMDHVGPVVKVCVTPILSILR